MLLHVQCKIHGNVDFYMKVSLLENQKGFTENTKSIFVSASHPTGLDTISMVDYSADLGKGNAGHESGLEPC